MGHLCPVSLPPIHKTPQPVIIWRRRASQPLGGLIFHFDYSCNNNNHYFMFYNSKQSRNYCTKTRSHLMIPPRRMRFSSSVRTSSESVLSLSIIVFFIVSSSLQNCTRRSPFPFSLFFIQTAYCDVLSWGRVPIDLNFLEWG